MATDRRGNIHEGAAGKRVLGQVPAHYAIPTQFIVQNSSFKTLVLGPSAQACGNHLFAVSLPVTPSRPEKPEMRGSRPVPGLPAPALSSYAYQKATSLVLAKYFIVALTTGEK